MSNQNDSEQDSENSQNSEYNQPGRKTPYTTISVTPDMRDAIRDRRDELGYETYSGLFRDILQNAEGGLTG